MLATSAACVHLLLSFAVLHFAHILTINNALGGFYYVFRTYFAIPKIIR